MTVLITNNCVIERKYYLFINIIRRFREHLLAHCYAGYNELCHNDRLKPSITLRLLLAPSVPPSILLSSTTCELQIESVSMIS